MNNLLEEIKTSQGFWVPVSTQAKGDYWIQTCQLPLIQNNSGELPAFSIGCFVLNDAVKLDVNAYEIQYDEATLMARRLDNEATLVVICSLDVNVPLVSMACGMQSAELLEAIAAYQGDVAVPAPSQRGDASNATTNTTAKTDSGRSP